MTAMTVMVSDVRLFIPNCPLPIILKELREAAISFATLSEALVERVDINLTAGQATYLLSVDAELVPYRVQRALLVDRPLEPTSEALLLQNGDYRERAGRPMSFFQITQNGITFFPTPSSDEVASVHVICKPSRASSTLRDDIAETHWETIVNGAIGRLASMAGSEWHNPDLAAQRLNAFAAGVREAKNLVLNDDKPKRRTVRYGGY